MYLDGKFEENPKSYSDGSMHYIDFCDGDQMSLLALNTMIVSYVSEGFFLRLWYHLSGTSLDVGLFELESDVDVLEMCQIINPKYGYVEIYVITILTIGMEKEMGASQEENLMQNPFPDSIQAKIDLEEIVREFEGLYKDFSDDDEFDSEYVVDASGVTVSVFIPVSPTRILMMMI